MYINWHLHFVKVMSYLRSEKSNILIREIIISIQASHQSLIKNVLTLYKNKSKGLNIAAIQNTSCKIVRNMTDLGMN